MIPFYTSNQGKALEGRAEAIESKTDLINLAKSSGNTKEWFPTSFEVCATTPGYPGAANQYWIRLYYKEWVDATQRSVSGAITSAELTSSEVGWLILTGVTNLSGGGPVAAYTGSTELAEGEVKIVDASGNKRVGWMINGEKKYLDQSGGTLSSTGDTFEAAEHFSHFSKLKITEATPAHFQQKYGYMQFTPGVLMTDEAVAVADIAE